MKNNFHNPLFDFTRINENILDPKVFNKVLGAKKKLTFGQRAADFLTRWAGSWVFIFSFMVFLILWMFTNVYFLTQFGKENFDPYPFILLNLVLSCLAALQAPIILMSQNRESERDRMRSEYDYAVNRKAEREIGQIQKQLNSMKRILLEKNKK